MDTPQIYLASQSPRRRELLAQIGVAPRVLPVDIDESVKPGEAPRDYVLRLAREKAEAAWRRVGREGLPVLAADTAVVLGQDILGKPESVEAAADMLRRLSGRAHQVLTAVALARENRCELALSVSEVEFRPLSEHEIARYAASPEPHDKAGAYAVQGKAAAFIARLSGSYSGVMGLPLYETAQLLQRYGIEVI